MTIRFLQQWSGYSPGQLASLTSAEETRLVGLGLASRDLDGDLDNEFMVKATTDSAGGNIKSATAGGKSILQAAAMIARSRSNIELIGNGSTGTVSTLASGGYTWQKIVAARSRPFACRVSYQNLTTSSYTVNKTTITPSTTFVAGDPTGGATPVNVLFSGGAPAVVPVGTANLPSEIMSDWMPIAPVDRADGGSYPLFHIRSYISAASAYPYLSGSDYAGNPENAAAGLVRACGFQLGDFIASPAGFTNNSGVRLQMNVEFKSLARFIRVAALGDSLVANNVTGNTGAWDFNILDRAVKLINPSVISYGALLSSINCGISSQTLPQFMARLPQILANHTPDVVVLPVWSPNTEPTTQAAIDANNNLVIEAINQILTAGAVPVLWTSPTQDSMSSAADTLRIANNNLWKTIAAGGGYYLADFASVLDGTPVASVTQWTAGTSDDGTHWNSTGQALCAPILADALKRACGLL
jgi:lysophospholipase L1-like esterase